MSENNSDTEYRERIDPLDLEHRGPRPSPFNALSFVDTSSATDPISLAVDPLRDGDGNNTFFLRLRAGDEVDQFSTSGSYKPLILVKRGNVVAFFTDLNNNNEYDAGELTGLSLGANVSVEIRGDVRGDIVTNLNEHGTVNVGDDTVDMSGLVNFRQGITDLKVLGGSVGGSVLSGGDIRSLTIARNVDSVLAGSAAAGSSFDFFTGSAGGEGVANSTARPGKAGSSITNSLIFSLTDRLEAGQGGAGAIGGSLSNIQITGDTDGFQLLAGAGGAGDVTFKLPNGGIGGGVRNVFITGVEDPSPNSPLPIVVKSGAGGDAVSNAVGGRGGGLVNVYVGFEAVGSTVVTSGELGSDSVVIGAGAGGAGKIGGVAGSLNTVKVRVRTPDVSGDEILVFGGLGGSSLSPGGRAGAGGSVSNVDIRNQILSPDNDILVLGGNGGTTVGNSLGANGGSVTNLVLLGSDLQIIAGDGSDGRIGGFGGSVKNVNILADEFILTRNLIVNAGLGGNGSAGNGGNGGVLDGVLATQVDVEALLINTGIAANGGHGLGGFGGRGGGVINVAITDIDGDVAAIEGVSEIRTGNGGDGTRGGGAGGSYATVDIAGHALNLKATAGNGGDAERNGNGGAGGGYRVFNFVSESTVGGIDVSANVQAGAGGNGVGQLKAGGAGGGASKLSLNLEGNATLIAGKGGNGQVTTGSVKGGAAGAGGGVFSSGVFALNGSGEIRAGNAGDDGSRPANGGGIIGDPHPVVVDGVSTPSLLVGVRGNKNITVVAGNGSHGGNGGDVRDVTYGSTSALLVPTPAGTIFVKAGDGSGDGLAAGRGGSINGVNGSVGSAANLPTTLLAGNGGGGANVRVSGDGGSISNISLSRGGGAGVVVTIQAGDAGDSPLAKVGGKGGGVRTVGITDLDSLTNLRSIAAGDGGDAARTGGAGGSIVDVNVQGHDIGVRTGQTFGYGKMGGIFVGAGGAAARAGLAGSVNGVIADSIASIVAGRGNVPTVAESVTNVYVNGGETETLLKRNGALVFNSSFRLTFGADQTPLLPGGATAAEVKAALDALPGIASAGGVDVIVTSAGGYRVTFVANGQRPAISGIETLSVDVTEVTKGQTVTATAIETVPGSVDLVVTEFRSGQNTLTVTESVPGLTGFLTSQIAAAVNGANEVQALDLLPLSTAPNSQFDLTFGPDFTAKLPANSTAGQIAAALNALPSITARGGVTVEQSTSLPRVFNITFLSGADENPIFGNFYVQEKQRLDLGTITAFPTGKFTLTFGTATTPQLAVNATAAQVAAALNALPTIVTAGGVTVSNPILGTFDILFTNVGDQQPLQSGGFVQELQTLALGSFASVAPGKGQFVISFGNETTAPLQPNATSAQVQAALNALPGIQAVGNVVVTAGLQNSFSIQFGKVGDLPSLSAVAIQSETQNLNLANVTSVDTAEFTLHVDHFVNVDESIKGTSIPVPSDTTTNGVRVDVDVTTVTNGTPLPNGTSEEQFLDLASVVAFAGPVGEFYLTFEAARNVFVKTTILPVLATAAQIDTALDAIVNGGVTVTPDAAGAPQAFSIVFNNVGNQPKLGGIGGLREVQTLDATQVAALAGSSLVFTLNGTSTIPIVNPANFTAANIDTELDKLPDVQAPVAPAVFPFYPGVSVTSVIANRFNVTFNDFGDFDQLTGAGGTVANNEKVKLDLSQFAAVPNTTFTLSFNSGTTAPIPVGATAADIQTAINALPQIKAIRAVNAGVVTVTTISPNVFSIGFNIFGDQPDFSGLLTRGTGTTPRLPYNSTPAQIEAALDAVSLVDTVVTAGATAGTFTITFPELGDQPLLTSVGYIHEKQKIDVYNVGQFQLSFNNVNTGLLPANATAQQVADALNALTTIQATGKPVTVVANADSSYNVVFGADNDQLSSSGVQFEDFTAASSDGSATDREDQFLTPIRKGEFNALFFTATARMLGAVADINEIDSNVFKSFVDRDGNGVFNLGIDTLHVGNFQLGDVPIDGLVLAKRFDQARTNVTPEAKFTATGFFDNDNII